MDAFQRAGPELEDLYILGKRCDVSEAEEQSRRLSHLDDDAKQEDFEAVESALEKQLVEEDKAASPTGYRGRAVMVILTFLFSSDVSLENGQDRCWSCD